jgi:AraC family transcriptional regulator of adaptative response/methylated-DNA-[protein]-cysteine methyltransferase
MVPFKRPTRIARAITGNNFFKEKEHSMIALSDVNAGHDARGEHGEGDKRNSHYATVAEAIRYLRLHAQRQPSLDDIAAHVGMSPFHFQRLFVQWAGVSPKRFLQHLTKERARDVLRETPDILDAAFQLGLSSPSRLHDLVVSCDAMSPGELKQGGAGVMIGYGFAGTPFGQAFIGWTARGVCHVEFFDEGLMQPAAPLQALRAAWPSASLNENQTAAEELAQKIFPVTPAQGKLHLVLKGTNFQIKVWEALLRIPPGRMLSYSQLAALAGVPRASRAVGSAMAANTIGYLIPCHRVIRNDGDIGHYRWDPVRKAALLGWEAARQDPILDKV